MIPNDYFSEEEIRNSDFLHKLTKNNIQDNVQNFIINDNNNSDIINTYAIKRIFEGRGHSFTADDNIDDFDTMATEFGKILDKVLGDNWGIFAADFTIDISNPSEVIIPQIVYDYSAKSPNKVLPSPKIFDRIEEVVDGKETGDIFEVWRQWYDYDLVIDIFHQDSIKARNLTKIFQNIFEMSKAHLKKLGVQSMRFAGEVDSRNSKNYRPDIPSRCLIYEVCLENITLRRLSTLQSINTILNSK